MSGKQEYKILSIAYDSHALSREVTKHLNDGWKLHGLTTTIARESWSHFEKQSEYTLYSQTVVRNIDED